MFGGDLPVMHQSREWERKMKGRPFTQRCHGCKNLIIHVCAHLRGTRISATAEMKAVQCMNEECK